MTHAPSADELLASSLADRCPAAWRAFESQHGIKVRRSIARVVSRFPGLCASDSVEEVYGELALRLLRKDGEKLRFFQSGRGLTLEQWLLRIAKQAAHDHVRRLRRRKTASLDVELAIAADDDPHAECLARQRSRMLHSAVRSLPPRERQLYELCFRAHTEPEDAAATMGIRVATVYSKKHKLMTRLSRVLSDDAALAA